ncbi:MAG: HIT family protein [Chloroflexi bacterium AL-W]|nr:HIT family protein [Chloroflexi bacterium AL-N1]NOK69273.1 HIT family protein [Chloroflexi bacterium AL-N10]NOK76334.1 HIT family protein [Chloroflexi bacterium AL-N5]NOK83451.1 HIT family protein [Chloroflexi bacterium AL-W]NOK91111.1 HIT family protein [Chloroflexi bacterium AL-N15]
MYERYQLDIDELLERGRTEPCFICHIVARHPDYPAHIVYEDATTVAFLDKYPPEYGWTLVAPREHCEQITGDFALDEHLELQRIVYRVSESVRQEVGAERIYLCSFGRNQGNAHVHWYVAPVPQDKPFLEQEPGIFNSNILRIPEEDQASLATRLQSRLQDL